MGTSGLLFANPLSVIAFGLVGLPSKEMRKQLFRSNHSLASHELISGNIAILRISPFSDLQGAASIIFPEMHAA